MLALLYTRITASTLHSVPLPPPDCQVRIKRLSQTAQHPASMTSNRSIPVEVEEAVIDQCADDANTLCRCALTCRDWLPRSRFYLFSAVCISTPDRLWSFCDVLDSLRSCEISFSPSQWPPIGPSSILLAYWRLSRSDFYRGSLICANGYFGIT
ncbi:hypothetical protein BD310DRAFT_1031446 [Dichomitus squalens]|uniref:F-box domain-containing protein n=1 Tax=Dichomitus squalens TaxID=114155 RepID=A0A4Q9PL82_9APHY|nr:hypothetical protein BD310DRAFT_1031446 [Dichomitus squalens]